jgi:SAM-dependent methyltransferase
MPISDYHNKHISRSDEETDRRIFVKELELKKILSETNYKPGFEVVRVAVLGCADKRFVKRHKATFEKLFQKPVEQITFDITIEHLEGEENVIQHDITTPIPNAPFDITFGHVVLKFIETSKQWDAIKSAYDALRSPGLGIFVYDMEDITTEAFIQADGYFSVPIETYKLKLAQENMKFKDLRWNINLDTVPIPIRGLKGGALVLEK